MTDAYVVVCRDGYISLKFSKAEADHACSVWSKMPYEALRPAYRIRIREKARPLTVTDKDTGITYYTLLSPGVHFGDPFNNLPAPGYEAR